jgi:hypothetical protein
MRPAPLLSPPVSPDTVCAVPRRRERAPVWRCLGALGLGGLLLGQTACSILSYSPTIEVIKATGLAANQVASVAPKEASDVVQHPHDTVRQVCIEYNRSAQAPGILPALQLNLQKLGIESRIYDNSTTWPDTCRHWLHYTAFIEWDVPQFGEKTEAYLTHASLTLRTDGRVLASATYQLEGFGLSKWASTRDKLAPVVKAVVRQAEASDLP